MWNLFKKNQVLNDKAIFFLSSFFLFVILSINIGILKEPFFTDEVGYWAAGAYFSGIDWSGIMTKSPYYGYGYGVFLAPLFMLNDSIAMFYCAVIINIIFAEGSFYCTYLILKKIMPNIKKGQAIIMAGLSCCYPAVIVFTNITMAEICVTFFVSLLICLVVYNNKKHKYLYGVITAFVAAFLVAIHLRMLIVVIALVIYEVILLVTKRCKLKDFFFIFILLAIFLGIVFSIKNGITNGLYTDMATQTRIEINDNIVDQLWFINRLLDINFWKYYFENLIAKLFYLSVSSFFIFDFAIVFLVKSLHKGIRDRKRDIINGCLFLNILVVLLLLYSAVLTPEKLVRLDSLMYGRYIEIIMPVYLGIGFASFVTEQKEEQRKTFFIALAFCSVFSIICFKRLEVNGLSGVFPVMLPIQITGLSGLPGIKTMDKTVAITFYAVLLSGTIGMMIYVISKKFRFLKSICIAVLWIFLAYNSMNNFLYNLNETTDLAERSKIARNEKIKETANYIDTVIEGEVLYLYDEVDNAQHYEMFTLQYDLVDTAIRTVSSDELQNLDRDLVVIVHYQNTNYRLIQEKCNCLFNNELFLVLKSSEIKEKRVL